MPAVMSHPPDNSTPAEPTFAPLSAAFTRDPYPFYAQLRQLRQPYYYAEADALLLAKFQDVDQAARHPKLVRSLDAFMSSAAVAAEKRKANLHDMPNHARYVQFSLLDSDGEVHHRLRMLVLKTFSRHMIARHRAMIERYVDRLLESLLARGEIDFVADLAAHVPGHIIGNVLGVPDEDCPQLKAWSEDVVQFFDVGRTAAHKQLAEQATTEFVLYLRELIALRRRAPQTDLISTLVAAEQAGALNETELISTCMLILMAGHGSTIDVLGSGLLALLKSPDALQRLRRQPDLLPSAVQEMFRYDAPLPYFHRYASEDVELLGARYSKGTKFGLLYGAANRDPDQFPAPDHFDVSRAPNRHIAFGRGAHLCLGNHLSRLDMEIIFGTLLKRSRAIELMLDEPAFKPGLSARGLQALPIRLLPN